MSEILTSVPAVFITRVVGVLLLYAGCCGFLDARHLSWGSEKRWMQYVTAVFMLWMGIQGVMYG